MYKRQVDDYTVDTEIIEQPVIKADIVPKVEPILEDVSTIPEEPIEDVYKRQSF